MALNTLDKSVKMNMSFCNGCGFCVRVCPCKNFSLDSDGCVEVVGEHCMLCGHCEASCPTHVFSVMGIENELGLRYVIEKQGVSHPGVDDIATLVRIMRSRRSCRNYKQVAVESGLIEDLVKIGTTAPSGTNSQQWSFKIVPDREGMLALGECVADYYRKLNKVAAKPLFRFLSRIFYGNALQNYYNRYYASIDNALRKWESEGEDQLFHGGVAAILVCGDKRASCPAEDSLLATQNILLAAHALGLGSCLIGFVVEAAKRDAKVRNACRLERNECLYSFIVLGYPADRYSRPAGRKIIVPEIIKTSQ